MRFAITCRSSLRLDLKHRPATDGRHAAFHRRAEDVAGGVFHDAGIGPGSIRGAAEGVQNSLLPSRGRRRQTEYRAATVAAVASEVAAQRGRAEQIALWIEGKAG